MPRGPDPTTRRSPTQGGREVHVRLSAEEYARLKATADGYGMTVPAYVRGMVLGVRERDDVPAVMAEVEAVEERSCLTCAHDYLDQARAFHFCHYDPIEDVLDYMADSGAETSPNGLPTDRTMRCPGWAAKETT